MGQTEPSTPSGVSYVDSNNNARFVSMADGKQRVISQDYLLAISEGDISNHEVFRHVGYTPLLTTTESDFWSNAGVYAFPTVGQPIGVTSYDAADSSGGAGAHFVRLCYLDTAYVEKTETVEMAGLSTSYTVAKDVYRINNFLVTSAGVFKKASGGIVACSTNGTIRFNYITPGFSIARNSAYTVPAGKTLHVTDANMGYGYAANQTNYARIYLRATKDPLTQNATTLFYPFVEVVVANNTVTLSLKSPERFNERTDIKISGLASAAGTAYCSLRGWTE